MSKNIGFIACINPEDTVRHYGVGSTPNAAIDDFTSSGEFIEYCHCNDINDETWIKIKAYRVVYRDTPEAEAEGLAEDFEDGWDWILREEVAQKEMQCLY